MAETKTKTVQLHCCTYIRVHRSIPSPDLSAAAVLETTTILLNFSSAAVETKGESEPPTHRGTDGRICIDCTSIYYYCCKSFPVLLHDVMVGE